MCFQRVRCCKTATFDNFCAISRATALEHHSANQFLKAATNLNVVQPKLFQATRQDDLRFSDCTVSVIQILDDADAAFRILGAGLRTVLSVTTMFADKPHRLNGRTSAQRFCVLTILPPVTALAVGLSTHCGDRRPKSAKARNRGKWGTGGAAGAYGDLAAVR